LDCRYHTTAGWTSEFTGALLKFRLIDDDVDGESKAAIFTGSLVRRQVVVAERRCQQLLCVASGQLYTIRRQEATDVMCKRREMFHGESPRNLRRTSNVSGPARAETHDGLRGVDAELPSLSRSKLRRAPGRES
jgi:hypothetical protein